MGRVSKLSFVLWFLSSYIFFLIVSTLVAVYGFEFRVGMEIQRYRATFAVKLLFVLITASAVVAGTGFLVVTTIDCA